MEGIGDGIPNIAIWNIWVGNMISFIKHEFWLPKTMPNIRSIQGGKKHQKNMENSVSDGRSQILRLGRRKVPTAFGRPSYNRWYPGWWLSPTPLKNDGVSNSWDDDIPNMMGKNESHVPNHQPVFVSQSFLPYPSLKSLSNWFRSRSVSSYRWEVHPWEVPVSFWNWVMMTVGDYGSWPARNWVWKVAPVPILCLGMDLVLLLVGLKSFGKTVEWAQRGASR